MKNTDKKILEIIENIEGYLTNKEAIFLFELAQKCTDSGVIVEIGSYKGKSTICLGKGSKSGKNVKVYSIDPHTGTKKWQNERKVEIWSYDQFNKNIKKAGVDDIVIPIVKTSENAGLDFNKPVELIFIDGDHQYDLVKLDFDIWFPKLIDGGIMLFHDSDWSGPSRVIINKIYRSRYFRNVGFVESITFAEKVSKNSMKDRLSNYFNFMIWKNRKLVGSPIKRIVPNSLRKYLKGFISKVF